MDKYRRVTPSHRAPASEGEIRVAVNGNVSNYLAFASNELLEGRDSIVIKGSGQASKLAVTVSEILKRRVPGLHQHIEVGLLEFTEEFEPVEEGLDRVVEKRRVPCISIQLSKVPLDTKKPGYQAPLSAAVIKAERLQRVPRDEAREEPHRQFNRDQPRQPYRRAPALHEERSPRREQIRNRTAPHERSRNIEESTHQSRNQGGFQRNERFQQRGGRDQDFERPRYVRDGPQRPQSSYRSDKDYSDERHRDQYRSVNRPVEAGRFGGYRGNLQEIGRSEAPRFRDTRPPRAPEQEFRRDFDETSERRNRGGRGRGGFISNSRW